MSSGVPSRPRYDVVCTARSSASSLGRLAGTSDETAVRVRDVG